MMEHSRPTEPPAGQPTDQPTDAEAFRPWRKLSLATQFALAGGVVMAAAAIGAGLWVSGRIEEAVVRNTANATALYMESFIAPLAQELAYRDELTDETRAALAALFADTPLGERVISYKLWKEGGRVAEASDAALTGRVFAPSEALRAAWKGEVQAEFEGLSGAESASEQALDLPLLEIYSPVREAFSGRVVSVVEFYEVNEQLANDLADARLKSWLAVAAVTLATGTLLFLIVHRGSVTIDRAREALTRRLEELAVMSESNRVLRLRVQEAAARAAAMNERAMRRVGADLHDGPAQHLGFAALRLDALRDATARSGARDDVEAVARAVNEAMGEIRSISRGLAAPEIEARGLAEVVAAAARTHASRTGAEPVLELALDDAPDLSAAAKICAYRFVQEGLTNATRHAEGRGVTVRAAVERGTLRLAVRDRGPGFAASGPGNGNGLGLAGLRDRVESIGGVFEARDRPDGGAEISMTLAAEED